MRELIPLLQSLVWPIFLVVLLFLAREQIHGILKSIAFRISRGDPFQAGPSGFSLGSSQPRLTRLDEAPEIVNNEPGKDGPETKNMPTESLTETTEDFLLQCVKVTYLLHSVSAPQMDTDGVTRRVIQVIVNADSQEILDQIERVVYHLHPTFPNPNREITDRQKHFELRTRAWGEFNLSADVYFRNYEKPLTLFRYLNFDMFGPDSSLYGNAAFE